MFEAAQREAEAAQQAAEASTPWFWYPRKLNDDYDSGDGPKPNKTRGSTTNIYGNPNQNQSPERPPSTQAQESFTSKGALQPTFSVNVIRTPNHYATPSPSRQGHRASAPAQTYVSPSRSLSRGASVDAITIQMSHLSTNNPSRHNSMPIISSTSNAFTTNNFTEEPAPMPDILSPLVLPMAPKPSLPRSSSGLGRHCSVPAVSTNLGPIPESASSASPSRARTPAPSRARTPAPPRRNSHPDAHAESHYSSRSRSSSRHASRSSSSSASPYSVPHSGEPSPTSPTYPHSSGHSPHDPHFPYPSQPPLKNPLPAPPAEVSFPSLPIHSISTTSPTTTDHTSPGTSAVGYIYSNTPTPTPSHSRTKSYSQQPQSSGTTMFHSNSSSSLTIITSSTSGSPPPSSSLDHSLPPPHHHLHHSHGPPDRPATAIPTSKPKRKSSTSNTHSHFPPSSTPTPTPSSTSHKSSPSSFTSKSGPRCRRKGYWNRRGDHVTRDGYVVYCPPDMVYPRDLDDYPDGKDGGYINEYGMEAPWGNRPPIDPPGGYKSIIEWVDV
ncbi:hypothetical protein AN958_00436 [Leucoagaricus sp. SymC.cos]|nr:hypothetical protein AN958_00436 [Leucoagaricus sp. SymC.cos]